MTQLAACAGQRRVAGQRLGDAALDLAYLVQLSMKCLDTGERFCVSALGVGEQFAQEHGRLPGVVKTRVAASASRVRVIADRRRRTAGPGS